MPAEPFTLLDLAELIRDRERNTLSRKILIHYNKKFLSKLFFGFYTRLFRFLVFLYLAFCFVVEKVDDDRHRVTSMKEGPCRRDGRGSAP